MDNQSMETSELFDFIINSLDSFFNDNLSWSIGKSRTEKLVNGLLQAFPGRIEIIPNPDVDIEQKAFDILLSDNYVITVFPLGNTFYFEA